MQTPLAKQANNFTQKQHELLAKAHQEKVARIIRERIALFQQCHNNTKAQAIAIALCSRDPVYFINYFVTTFDPRESPSVMPFILFDRQEDCVWWIKERIEAKEWGMVVKCRDTGLSWIFCAVYVWYLLFVPNFTGTLASNKATQVDKKYDKDCLFEKVVMMLEFLPAWMHDLNLKRDRTHMLIKNPYNNSQINGKSGADIGRGGRSTAALGDEFGFIEQDKAAISALSRNTDSAFLVSTPNGTDNKFFEYYDQNRVPLFVYNWQSDPRRSPEWRAQQDILLGEDIAAQELDCDFYAGSGTAYIKPKWIATCIDAHLKIPELRRGVRQAGLDIGATNDNSILTIRDGQIVNMPIALPKAEPTQTALETHRRIQNANINTLLYDADGLGRDVDGTLNQLDDIKKYRIIRFYGAGKTSNHYWTNHKKHSKDLYLNKRAEAWGYTRWKILNTYNHINGLAEYLPNEMISLPNSTKLKNDLCKPKIKYQGTKLRVESKLEMKARNIKSPDYADSLVYALYDLESGNWLDYC